MNRRKRRSNRALLGDVFEAIEQLVEEQGYTNLKLQDIAQKADVNIGFVNRNIGSLTDVLNEFTKGQDFWLYTALDSDLSNSNKTFWEQITRSFVNELWDNKQIQELIIWGMCEDNDILTKSAIRREEAHEKFMIKYEKAFKSKNINMRAVFALLSAGAFYLIARRSKSLFCGIDFTTDEGKETLIEAGTAIILALKRISGAEYRLVPVIKSLKEQGVTVDIIAKATKLSPDYIKKL